MVLKFQIKMLRPKNPGKLLGKACGPVVVFLQKGLGNGTAQAGRQGNQALVVGLQQFHIHPGLAVKSMQKGLRNQIAQVFVACSVFAQQHQMVGVVVNTVNTVRHPAASQIDLAPDNGLDPGGLGGLVKINAAVHHTVIRQGNGTLAQLFHPVHHAVNAAGSIQKAVFTMDMQMYKAHVTPPWKAARFAAAGDSWRAW